MHLPAPAYQRQTSMNSTLSLRSAPPLTVRCQPVDSLCDQSQTFAVIVTGSYDVQLRFESPDSDDVVANVQVLGSEPQQVVAQLIQIDDVPVLQLSATDGALDVALRRRQRLTRVVNHGSGRVTVREDVLASTGTGLTLSANGSGDLFATSSASVEVDELSISAQGSGRVEATFAELHTKAMTVEAMSSGNVVVSSGSTATTDELALKGQGSGAMCVTSGASLDAGHVVINGVGSGDVSLGPRGSCQKAEVTVAGSGRIDVGAIECSSVNVDLLGSATVIVQATDKLSGDAYGSGRLHYSGGAPRSIDNVNFMGLVSATPVSDAYHPSGCAAFAAKSPDQVVGSTGSGERSYRVTLDEGSVITWAGVAFLVAIVLRWFNESRRQAREEQRRPLVGAQQRVYV